MKCLFLDIDGVLNCPSWQRANPTIRPPINPEAVARLERIVASTGAQVVISSAWRGNPVLEPALRDAGFTGKVIGITPYFSRPRQRGEEIAAWLAKRPGVTSFVILDDDDDMIGVERHLIRTDYRVGLLDEHVEAAIALLNP